MLAAYTNGLIVLMASIAHFVTCNGHHRDRYTVIVDTYYKHAACELLAELVMAWGTLNMFEDTACGRS